MIPRVMARNPMVLWALFVLGVIGGCRQDQEPGCGDGQVGANEQCDDGNLLATDGCDAACKLEPVLTEAMQCEDVVEAYYAAGYSLAVSDSGLVALSGAIAHGPNDRHGWVAGYRPGQGVAWELELEVEGSISELVPFEGGFRALRLTSSQDFVIELDLDGNLVSEVEVPMIDGTPTTPYEMIGMAEGLLLAGVVDGDMWLARLDAEGELETLIHEDYNGLDDAITTLVRHEDRIAALAHVGRVEHNDGDDFIEHDTQDTLLIVYDEQLNELSRTILTSGNDEISILGFDLAARGDRWFVAGQRRDPNNLLYRANAWAAAVESGEVVWTYEAIADADNDPSDPHSGFYAVAAGRTVIFAGAINLDDAGNHRWAVELAPRDGAVVGESVERDTAVADSSESYSNSSAHGDELWLGGRTVNSQGMTLWLCNVEL